MRFPGFDGEWESKNFNDVFTILPNNTLSRADLKSDGEVHDIHYGDVLIKYGSILDMKDEEVPYIVNGKEGKESSQLQNRDIVIADTAEDETAGKAIEIYNAQGKQIEAGLHTIPCRPISKYASMYLGYYMNSEFYHRQLLPLLQGVKVLSVSKGNISKTVITAPKSLTEQKKISSLLYLISLKIEKQRQLIDTLKIYKRGLQNRFFLKRSQLSKLHEIKPLGTIVQINPKTGLLPEEFIYIDLECVENGIVHNKNLISRNAAPSRAQRLLKEGDIIYQMVRPYQKNNYYFQKSFEYPAVASTGYAQIRCSVMDAQFIYEQLSSDYFAREAMLRSTGTGYPAINANDLANIPVWVPPLEMQKKVGTVLSHVGARIEVNQEILSALGRMKSSLLQQLFI